MNEHYERLCAMRDDNGLTWDLSGNDREAFKWAVETIDEMRGLLWRWIAVAGDRRLNVLKESASLLERIEPSPRPAQQSGHAQSESKGGSSG